MPEHSKEDDDSFEAMKGSIARPYPVQNMTGDTIEMLAFCQKIGAWVEFEIHLNRRALIGLVKKMDRRTGRVTIVGGQGSGRWIKTFLIKNVKIFTYSADTYEEWEKSEVRK